MKTALILGIGGQDGSYLADVLLEKGYKVHGLYRHSSVNNLTRLDCQTGPKYKTIKEQVTLHQGDLLDSNSIRDAIAASQPDEVYNEADQDNVGVSHNLPGYTCDITGSAVGKLLEILRGREIKFFQPLSATMFGNSPAPQNEDSRHDPKSPYACAKCFAYHLCRYYRDTYGMFVTTGIFYNHDSSRRSDGYLLQTICRNAFNMGQHCSNQKTMALGNLDLRVDIGYAKEYMEAAHSIMQLDKPSDFVIGSDTAYSIGKLANMALNYMGMNSEGRITKDPKYYRKDLPTLLVGDNTKARETFGWSPQINGEKLIRLIMNSIGCERG